MNDSIQEQPLTVEVVGGYALLTLNREAKRNALSKALLTDFRRTLDELRGVCSAIVVTGAGERAFSAGMDLAESKAAAEAGGREFAYGSMLFWDALEDMRRHPAIFIAAVNGFALGGGLTIANNSEIALAADHATFGMPEVTFGAFPGLAGPTTIHRILPKHAAWMILTGERVDATTAQAWGLINEVTPAAGLLPRAREIAERISGYDPVMLDYTKKGIRDIADLEWTRAVEYGLTIGNTIGKQSAAAREGISAFAEGDRSSGQGGSAATE